MAILPVIMIYGRPLIFYLGITTFTLVIMTAAAGFMIMKGIKIPLKVHTWLARIAILFALIHATFGISMYL